MAKAKANQTSAKRGELLSIAQGLNIADCEAMSTKALKRAIKEAQEAQPVEPIAAATEELPPIPAASDIPAEAPKAESAPKRKPKAQPVDSTTLANRLAKAAETIGQVEGAPKTGEIWVSDAGHPHTVLGSWVDANGVKWFRTCRHKDGREFVAQCKSITLKVRKQTGTNGATVAPAQVVS